MKRRKELHGLSDSHHTALIVAFRCKRAGAGQGDLTVDEAWSQAKKLGLDHLADHFRVEEELLLPALRELGEATMAERIAAEHQELRQFLEVSGANGDQVAAFGDLLDRHIRYEERIVFEQTQDRLPQTVMDAIATSAPHDRSCSVS
ncbi:MAG: hypothetical protein ACI8TX_000331 [Hyphomicrobiaceae bacterium]|jgi:hypothetical protein